MKKGLGDKSYDLSPRPFLLEIYEMNMSNRINPIQMLRYTTDNKYLFVLSIRHGYRVQ